MTRVRRTQHRNFTRRCTHHRGRPRHQLELRQAVRGTPHACGHRRQGSGQIALQTLEKTHGVLPIRVRRKRTSGRRAAVRERRARSWCSDARRTQHRRSDGRHLSQRHSEADPTLALETLRNSRSARFWSVSRRRGSCAERTQRQWRERNDHLHERQRGAERLPASGAFAMACQAKSGLAQSMARDRCRRVSHRQRADRRRDRLDAGRRHPCSPTGGDDRQRQHGRPGPHRGNLSASAPPASVDVAFEVILRPWVENGDPRRLRHRPFRRPFHDGRGPHPAIH